MNAPIEIISNLIRDAHITAWFFDAGLKSFLVLALAGGICALGRRASAATRHLIWFLAMVSLPCLPLLTGWLPSWEKPLWSVATGFDQGNQVSLALEFSPGANVPAASGFITTSGAVNPGGVTAGNDRKIAARFNVNWLAYGLGVWAAGVVLILVRTAGAQWRLHKFSRSAQPCQFADGAWLLDEARKTLRLRRAVRLLQSAGKVMPLTWGWWQPVVLLPAAAGQWPEERRRIVLLHELAHVKRRDCLTQFITKMICAFYWFNPLAWLAARQMGIERERACDDLVLAGGCKASDYAGHLVAIAGSFRRGPQMAAIAMARPSGLEQRVAAIVDDSRARCRRPVTLLAILLATGMTIFSAGGCKTRVASPGANESSPLRGKQIARLEAFSKLKEKQSATLAAAAGETISPEFQRFFAAATQGDYQTVTNMYEGFKQRHPQYGRKKGGHSDLGLRTSFWSPVLEVCLAYDLVVRCTPEYTQMAVDGIIDSIPPGSVYFGGTDPGRGLPTAFSRSQPDADPFYTLTQNALADGTYVEYLRQTYGEEKNLLAAEIVARRSDKDLQKLDAEWAAAVRKLDALKTDDTDPRYQAARKVAYDLEQKKNDRTQAILAGVKAETDAPKIAGGNDRSAAGVLYLPTSEDAQRCFADYVTDVRQRSQNHQLKPGEQFKDNNGRVQISGQVDIMEINGRLVKLIFDKNPGHEFFIEESWPLDWMYPYLEPHGLILKINRQPLTELTDADMQQDRALWQGLVPGMIGGWLNDDTSVPELTAFADKVFIRHDLAGFTGDPHFVQNDYACRMFARLRCSLAGLYAWRAEHATTASEQERMAREADFAFRQSLAMCPYSPEVAQRYADFLKHQNRTADAGRITDLAGRFTAKNAPVFQLRLVLDAPADDSEPMTEIGRGTQPPEALDVQKTVLLDQTTLKSATVIQAQSGAPRIEIVFTADGQTQFAEITREHLGQRLAFIIDGKLWMAPHIKSEITRGNAEVTGSFTEPEAKDLAAKITAAIEK